MMDKIVILAVVYLTILAVKAITGVGFVGLVGDGFGLFKNGLNKHSAKKIQANQTKFNQMTAKEKKKSKRFKWYSFINEILLDMGWKNKKITVEGIVTLLLTASYFFGGFVWIAMKSFLLALLLTPVFFMTTVAFLFLVSRINHTHRKQALMDAEDIICANMSQGTVAAIENNIDSFDPFVIAPFRQFLDEIYNRNASVETALTNLNINCGEQMDVFCDKAKTYERERRPGMENVFQYNINRNAEIRILDRECAKAFTAMNRNYLLSLAIICGFVLYTLAQYSRIRLFYSGGLGKFVLALYFVSAALVFIYIQYIQSKPFRYGQKGIVPDMSASRNYEERTYNRTKQAAFVSKHASRVGEKVEPLAVKARKILLKKKSEVTDEDIEDLKAYQEELRRERAAMDEEGADS